jgi:hypothetical protein
MQLQEFVPGDAVCADLCGEHLELFAAQAMNFCRDPQPLRLIQPLQEQGAARLPLELIVTDDALMRGPTITN